MKKCIFILFLLFNIFIFSAGCTFAAQESKIYEQCFLSKISDKQVGYSCASQKQVIDDDKTNIITNYYSELTFKRFGFIVKMIQDTDYIEDLAGNPISFESKIQSLGQNIHLKGKFITPEKISLTSISNGNEDSSEINTTKKILFPYAIEKLFTNNRDKDNIEYSTIYPGQDFRIINVKNQKSVTENILTNTGVFPCIKYKVSTDLLPNINNYEWRNSDGRICKEYSNILNIEKIAASKNSVNNTIETVDLIRKVMIPVDLNLPDLNALDQVFYKVLITNKNSNTTFTSDDRQKVIQTKGDTLYLKVKREKNSEYFKYPVKTKGYENFLISSPYITSNDIAVRNQAKSIIGKDSNAYIVAKSLEKWVYGYIFDKNYTVDFANASQTLTSKQGDCTEHSVLLAALLRAINIPSKVIVGLVYSPENKAFIYHMWVKAYIGEWINLDPSFPQSDSFSPLHIEISESALNNIGDKTALTLNIAGLLSKIQIEIINTIQIKSVLTDVKITPVQENVANERFNLVSLIKAGSKTSVKNIDAKNPSTSEQNKNEFESPPLIDVKSTPKTMEDHLSSAYYFLANNNINAAKESFVNASRSIKYNNDFATKKLAVELANLGFFNMAQDLLSSLTHTEIWGQQIDEIKRTYFPKTAITPEQELLLAELLSKLKYHNDTDGAISLVSKNKNKIGHIDYTHFILAKAYRAKNNKKMALNEYIKAINSNPNNLLYRFDLANYYNEIKMYKKAKKEVSIIIKQNPTDKNFVNLAKTEFYYAKAQSEPNNLPKNSYYMAKYYQQKGQSQAAISNLNKTIKNKKANAEVYRILADLYSSLGNNDGAIKNYKLALSKNPKNTFALYGLGNIYKNSGKNEVALNYYKKALKYGTFTDLLLAAGDAYKALSLDKNAFLTYAKAVKLDSNNYHGYLNLANIYLSYKDYVKAKEFFRYAGSINPEQPAPWLKLAKIEINSKNYFLAKTYLDRVNFINSKIPDTYYYLGLIYKKNDNLSEAKAKFSKAIELNPEHYEALDELKQIK